MKTFTVAVVWSEMGYLTIQAESVEEAKQKAIAAPLPDNREYLEDSFQIDSVEEDSEFVPLDNDEPTS